MKQVKIKGLRVIELPYIPCYGHDVKRTYVKRELDDYKLCGVYSKAMVPYDVAQAVHKEEDYPEGGSKAYGALNNSVCSETVNGIRDGNAILLTGGGCGHVVGLLGGIQQIYGKDEKIGFIWVDAHGDFNTPETTLTGLMGGMPLAVIAGRCCDDWRLGAGLEVPIETGNIILTDGRSLDPMEELAIIESDIEFLNTEAFNDKFSWQEAVNKLAEKVDVICLHIDADILDAQYVPDHYTAEANGPSIETVIDNIKWVMQTGKVIGYSVLSVYHEAGKEGRDISTLNGMRLIGAGLEEWKLYPDFRK